MSSAHVLVTDATTGAGRLTCLALARRGHRVFASMREPSTRNRAPADELRALAEAEKLALRILELDVTSEGSVEKAVATAIAKAGHLDAVIHNAGDSVGGLSETVTPAQLLHLFDTSLVGIQRVNRAVLPSMRARKAGLLVHMSSSLGRLVMPFVGVTAATMWAIEALAETYRYELKVTGVEVAIVEPAAVPTELAATTGADAARATGYGALAGGRAQATEPAGEHPPGVPPHRALEAQHVADAIVELVEAPAGKRPARVVVDRHHGEGIEDLNAAHAQIQRELLARIGLPFLAD